MIHGSHSPTPRSAVTSLFAERTNVSSHYFSKTEQQAFVSIINSTLQYEPVLSTLLPIPPETKYIQNVVENGILLCKLLERWVPGSLDPSQINLSPKNKFDMLDNHTLMLNTVKRMQCKIGYSLRAMDMFDIQPHLLLALIWQILQTGIRRKIYNAVAALHLEKECAGLTALQTVLFFFNSVFQAYKVEKQMKNFTTDISDSEAYVYSLHYLVPNECNLDILKEPNLYTRAEMVLQTIRRLGFIEFITPEAIVAGNQRLNSLFATYLLTHAYALHSGPREPLVYHVKVEGNFSQSVDSIIPRALAPTNGDSSCSASAEIYDGSSQQIQLNQRKQELLIREEALRLREEKIKRLEEEYSIRPRPNNKINNAKQITKPMPVMRMMSSPFVQSPSPIRKRSSGDFTAPTREEEAIIEATPEFPTPFDVQEHETEIDLRNVCLRRSRSNPNSVRSIHLLQPPSEVNPDATTSKKKKETDDKHLQKRKRRRKSQKISHRRTRSKMKKSEMISDSIVLEQCNKVKESEEINLKDLLSLVHYIQQQNVILKKQLNRLRSAVEDRPKDSRQWSKLFGEMMSDDLSLEEIMIQCWKNIDECNRTKVRLFELQQRLGEEEHRNNMLALECQMYKDNVKRLQSRLADLTKENSEQKAAINELTPKKKESLGRKLRSLTKSEIPKHKE